MKKVKLFLCVLLALVSFSACMVKYNGFVFGTDFNISAKTNKNEIKKIENDLAFLESILSTTIVDSDIHKINNNVNIPITCNKITFDLIKLAFSLFEETEKTFNVSIFPLVELWKFDPQNFRYDLSVIPNEKDILDALYFCQPSFFVLNDKDLTVTKTNQYAKLDLGGIAKGFAVDFCFEKLKEKNDIIVNIGGTIRTDSNKKFGIQNPRYEGLFGAVSLNNQAIATSGDYQRFFKIGSQRYHHILNLDGYPSATDGLISVSVIGESATICDAYSTACMILGVEKSKSLLAKSGYSAILITEKNYTIIGDVNFEEYDERFVRVY